MRLYNHRPGEDVSLINDVDPQLPLETLIEVAEGDYVFLDDHGEPVDVRVKLVELIELTGHDDRPHHHVHHHPCRRITVEVVYNGRTVRVEGPPNMTAEAVLLQAIADFGIDPATGADLVLRRPGSDDDISSSTPIGELVSRGECSLFVDLRPGHREQG